MTPKPNDETSRRGFLAASLAALAAGPAVAAAASKEKKAKAEAAAAASQPATTQSSAAGEVKVVDDFPFQPATLFLTWQRDPTTTMTVQWVAAQGETADTTVFYSASKLGPWVGQKPTVKPYPTTDLKVFRAELTGLKPDTYHYFRIGKSSPTYTFRTMPAKATDSIHFISGGDSGSNPHAIANNIQAARQDPMFVVIGGDIAYENGRSADVHLSFLRNYSKHMVGRENRLIPLIGALGNHEVDGGYAKPRAKAPFFYSVFDGLYPETGYASLDFGDYLSLVLLDTGHTSAIEGEQTAWLEKTLKDRVDHPNVLVVNHVPAYPSFRKMATSPSTQPGTPAKAGTGAGNREHWCPLFDKYRVPIVLEHHDHTFKRTKPLIDGMENANGVQYLGDGSWGRLRAPAAPDKLSFLAKSSRDFHLSLHRIQGEERFHLALDEFGRVMDVGHSGQRRKGLVQVPRAADLG